MITNKQIVSRITNTLKTLTKDDRVSRRYILNTARDIATTLISQKLRDRSLYREDNLYISIDCFELEPQNIYECDIVEFRSCQQLMKSTKKLPELVYSRYGSSIKEIRTIDTHSKEFKPITLSQYRRDKNRRGKPEYNYYYISDGYLYIPDSSIEVVSLYILTVDEHKALKSSSCNKDQCSNAWNSRFNVPDKLLQNTIDLTIRELTMNKQIIEDSNPNLDPNQKQ